MTTKTTPRNRHHKLQESYLKQLAQIGPFVEGTLSEYKRAGRKASSWHLTCKIEGKTHTVYVPRHVDGCHPPLLARTEPVAQ